MLFSVGGACGCSVISSGPLGSGLMCPNTSGRGVSCVAAGSVTGFSSNWGCGGALGALLGAAFLVGGFCREPFFFFRTIVKVGVGDAGPSLSGPASSIGLRSCWNLFGAGLSPLLASWGRFRRMRVGVLGSISILLLAGWGISLGFWSCYVRISGGLLR